VTVENSQNLPGQLRARGLNVINLGQAGNGPLLELAILREYGLRLHAKKVGWLFYLGNDFMDLDAEKGYPALAMEPPPGMKLDAESRHRRTDELWREFLASEIQNEPRRQRVEMLRFLRLARVRTQVLTMLRRSQISRVPDEDIRLMTSIVRAAKAESEAAGSTFTFVFLPPTGLNPYWGVAKEDGEALKSALGAAGIRVVDFGSAVARVAEPQRLYSFGGKGGHYSPEGYRLLAQFVAASVH
jgi:hypothetical protein